MTQSSNRDLSIVELFSIYCTTCRARLKVQDESAIGQILSCPKCHSMVQVVPPEGWQRAAIAAPATQPAAVERVASKQPAAAVKSATPTTAPVAAKTAVGSAARASAPPTLPATKVTGSAKTAARASATKTAAAAASAAPATAAPAMAATVAAPISTRAALVARLRQDWLLLSGGLVGGVVLGIGCWLLMAAANTPDDPAAAVVPAASSPAVASSAIAASTSKAPEPESVRIVTNKPVDVAAEESPVEEPTAEETPAEESETAKGATAEAAPKAAEAVVDEEPAATPEPTKPEPAKVEIARAEPAAAKAAPVLENSSRAAEFAERLADKLPGVEFDKVQLGQFIEFVAQLTALPITIDAEALAKVGKSRETLVSVKLADATVAQILRTALSKHGLTWSVRDDKLVVTVARPVAKPAK